MPHPKSRLPRFIQRKLGQAQTVFCFLSLNNVCQQCAIDGNNFLLSLVQWRTRPRRIIHKKGERICFCLRNGRMCNPSFMQRPRGGSIPFLEDHFCCHPTLVRLRESTEPLPPFGSGRKDMFSFIGRIPVYVSAIGSACLVTVRQKYCTSLNTQLLPRQLNSTTIYRILIRTHHQFVRYSNYRVQSLGENPLILLGLLALCDVTSNDMKTNNFVLFHDRM